MSNMNWVDKAFVGILPDASKFVPEANRAITKALNDIERRVTTESGRITRRFDDMARGANRALDGIGRDAFDGLRTDADRAAHGVNTALDGIGRHAFDGLKTDADRAARGVEDAFDGVGSRAFDGLKADANRAAENIGSEFEGAEREADRALRGIGSPGQFLGIERQADRAADRIGHDFLRARTSVGFSLGALTTRASVAGGLIGAALGTVGAAAVKMGLTAAASMEQAEISFTQLLGSGQRAKNFLAELNRFGAQTPFELPGLIATSRQLLGAGQAAKDIIPILTAVGNATGALGLQQEQFEGIMLAVTQAMNKGRLQGEELMQMQERGLPVTALLAKALGVTTKRVGELAQAGKLTSSEVLPKLFDQMQKDYGGSMIKQSRTLNGLWSTFVDTTRNALREGIQPLLPAIKDALPEAARILEGAIRSVVSFFRDDLGPELGRIKQAWDDNGTAILGLFTNMASGRGEMDSSKTAAQSLADSLVVLTNALGDAARFGDQLGRVLNIMDETLDRWGSTVHERGVAPANDMVKAFGEWIGVNQLVGRITRDVTADLGDLGIKLGQTSHETSGATSAADDHTAALRDERSAVRALTGALDNEREANLSLRQAELNVEVAQKRVNELKRQGRTKSLEYRQAQISLERAQLALSEATGTFRQAVSRSGEAERLAASRSEALRGAQQRLHATTIGARKEITQFGIAASEAFAKLKSKSVKVTANYNVGAPKGIELLIEKGLVRRASGGPLRGPGTTTSDDIPVLASDQEHMVAAREVLGLGGGSYERGHQVLKQMRSEWRRYATGGPVLQFNQTGTDKFIARPPRFDRNLDRSLDLLARGFGIFVRQNRDSIFGGGKAEVKAFVRSLDPLRYCWGGGGPSCYDCSGAVGAVHLAHLGRPHGHGQRIYTTSSIHAGLMGLKSGLGGNTLEIGVTAGTGHMAGRYGGPQGIGFEARSTRTGIFTGSAARPPESFARHYHLAQGGPVTLEELLKRHTLVDIGGDPGTTRAKVGRPFTQYDSFQRGAWETLRDQLAMVHRGEMVVPADFASGLRSAMAGGGESTADAIRDQSVDLLDGLVEQTTRSLNGTKGQTDRLISWLWRIERQLDRQTDRVVHWLWRVANNVGGGSLSSGSRSSRPAARPAAASRSSGTSGSGRLTAQQLVKLSDNERWAYVEKYGLPKAPAGYKWVEDFTYVPLNFHQGGTLPEDIWGMGRSGRTYNFQEGERVTARSSTARTPQATTTIHVQQGAVQISVQGSVSPAMLPQITSSVEDGLHAVLREFRTGTAA